MKLNSNNENFTYTCREIYANYDLQKMLLHFIPKTNGKITLENGLIKNQMKIIFISKGYLQKIQKDMACKTCKW